MIKIKEHKFPQHNLETEEYLAPKKLIIPLCQNIGKASQPVAGKGDEVKEGVVIAEPGGFVSSRLHAPCSGKITIVDKGPHPVRKRDDCVYLTANQSEPRKYEPRENISALSKEQLLDIVKNAGIVGMGGACFPTHVKLNPPRKIDTLLINGCECEPYLSCDNRLMIEKAKDIFRGVELICRMIEPEQVIFCVEENKPEAIKKFNRYISTRKFDLPSARLAVLRSFYPQGGEKQLIYQALHRKVPCGKIPFEVGCMVQNVATCFAVYEAVYFSKPLIERTVTFAGDCLKNPKNLRLKIGTTVKELIEEKILELAREPKKVIFGGPMMGITVDSLEYPIMKGSSGVLFLSEKAAPEIKEDQCIRCGRCVDACPMNLLPLEYVKRVKEERFSSLDEVFIKDCIECGSCSFSCPAGIPIVHYIKRGKAYASGC